MRSELEARGLSPTGAKLGLRVLLRWALEVELGCVVTLEHGSASPKDVLL